MTINDQPRRRIRILHVVLNVNEGGLERILGDLVRSLDPARFETHILVLEFLGRLSRGLDQVARLHVCPEMSRYSMLRPATLAREIRRIGPDVLHMHTGVWYKTSLAARMAGVKHLVYTEHGRKAIDPWRDRFIDRIAAGRTDAVVAVSELLAEQMRDRIVGDPSKIHVIINGIDSTAFQPQADNGRIRGELGISSETPILGSIGRLAHIKGFDIMIDAFATLIRNWHSEPRPVLLIAGDGPERASLEAQAAASGAGDFIHLMGWRDDVHDLHAAFTLYTMSSRSEGTSIGLLEAMSAGLCPVVSDVGGNRAVLGSQLRHRLCPPRDADGLSLAWRDALADRAKLRADGEQARRRVLESFSLENMVEQYEGLYEQLVAI